MVYLEVVLLDDSRRDQDSGNEFPLNDLIDHFSLFKGVGKVRSTYGLRIDSIVSEKIQRFANTLVSTRQNIKFCVDCLYLTGEINVIFVWMNLK